MVLNNKILAEASQTLQHYLESQLRDYVNVPMPVTCIYNKEKGVLYCNLQLPLFITEFPIEVLARFAKLVEKPSFDLNSRQVHFKLSLPSLKEYLTVEPPND